MPTPWKETYNKPRQHIKKQRHQFAKKGLYTQSYGFSSSHVWVWELEYKESWALKNWCFWTVVLEKTLESPLECKEIKLVSPKGNQLWISIESTVAEAPKFGHLMWRANSLEKSSPAPQFESISSLVLSARNDWREKEKEASEDEMVGWHHWLNGHEFE